MEETNVAGAVVARYSQTQNIDEPLAMLRSSATNCYHADGLGSVTSLSNAAGSIANTYTYDSFGKLMNVLAGFWQTQKLAFRIYSAHRSS